VTGPQKDKTPDGEDAVNEQIGAKLRQVYSEVAAEPVPDRFAELLKQLGEATETAQDQHAKPVDDDETQIGR